MICSIYAHHFVSNTVFKLLHKAKIKCGRSANDILSSSYIVVVLAIIII